MSPHFDVTPAVEKALGLGPRAAGASFGGYRVRLDACSSSHGIAFGAETDPMSASASYGADGGAGR